MEEKNKKNAARSVSPPRLTIDPQSLKRNLPNPEVEVASPAKIVQAIDDESPRKNPPKLMEGLRVLDCLELDTNSFRSTYLYCKHHGTIIEEETGERNQLVYQEIKAYKKAYADYQVRRVRRAQCKLFTTQTFEQNVSRKSTKRFQFRCRPPPKRRIHLLNVPDTRGSSRRST